MCVCVCVCARACALVRLCVYLFIVGVLGYIPFGHSKSGFIKYGFVWISCKNGKYEMKCMVQYAVCQHL